MFTVPLADQAVKEKETAVFSCEIDKDNLKVKWYKGDEELKGGAKYSLDHMGHKYMLTVRDCQLEDETEYTIVAEEGVDATAKLSVEGQCSGKTFTPQADLNKMAGVLQTTFTNKWELIYLV